MRIILFLLFSVPFFLKAQPVELNLLGTWSDSSLPVTNAFNSIYNEIWGVVVNDREIAVIGTTVGTHFIDVTDPTNPVELTNAFVEGAATGPNLVHRDYHDFQGFLYAVADEGFTSTLQIIDIRNLPESTTVVSDNNDLLINSHNVFIDSTQARLYACGVRLNNGINGMTIYDISDPVNPIELGVYNTIEGVEVERVHDIFVRDNIAYINEGNRGFLVVDFSDPDNPILLGTMTDYPQAGFNHSGWLDHLGNYYFLADENHGLDLKVVDVCEPDDLEVVQLFDTGSGIPTSIPHNILLDCNLLFASWYYEGIQIFDITDPLNPTLIGFYDTFDGPDAAFFAGNWGVYPYLPSGNILASDMQGGLFIVENPFTPDCDAYMGTVCDNAIVPVEEAYQPVKSLNIFPQPVQDQLTIEFILDEPTADLNFSLTDISGRQVAYWNNQSVFTGENKFNLDIPNNLNNGFYIMVIKNKDNTVGITRKVVIQR